MHQLSQLYQFYFNSINYIELIFCQGILLFSFNKSSLFCYILMQLIFSPQLSQWWHCSGVFYYHKQLKTQKCQNWCNEKIIQTFYFSQTSSIRSTVPPLTGSHIPSFYCMLSLDPFLMWILMILQHSYSYILTKKEETLKLGTVMVYISNWSGILMVQNSNGLEYLDAIMLFTIWI